MAATTHLKMPGVHRPYSQRWALARFLNGVPSCQVQVSNIISLSFSLSLCMVGNTDRQSSTWQLEEDKLRAEDHGYKKLKTEEASPHPTQTSPRYQEPGAGITAQHVKPLLGTSASHFRVQVQVPVSPLLIHVLLMHQGRQQKMARVLLT